MKLNYYPETDSLYIDLSSKTSENAVEISPGVVIDFDAENNIVGIQIDIYQQPHEHRTFEK